MTTVALVGFATLLLTAFGLRTMIHLRRTGRSGWVLAPTPAAAIGDGTFAVGLGSTLVSPVLGFAGVVHPSTVLDDTLIEILGAAMLITGAALALTAQHQMGNAWRAGIDPGGASHLVTNGVFRVVRNPFYLGIIVAAGGVALIVPNVVSLAGCAALASGSEIDVRLVEEPNLRRTFGQVYASYCNTTPRFLPRLAVTAGRNQSAVGPE